MTGTENTFSGNWTVSNGTLVLGNGASVGTGVIALENAGSLSIQGTVEMKNDVTSSSASTVTVREGAALTISGKMVMDKTIVNKGNLSIGSSGSLGFASFKWWSQDAYTLRDRNSDASSTSGYMKGEFIVVDGAEGADIGNAVTIGGKSYAVSTKEDGIYADVNTGEKVDGGLYYIFSGTVAYNDSSASYANYDYTTGIVMYGGTLVNEWAVEGIRHRGHLRGRRCRRFNCPRGDEYAESLFGACGGWGVGG